VIARTTQSTRWCLQSFIVVITSRVKEYLCSVCHGLLEKYPCKIKCIQMLILKSELVFLRRYLPPKYMGAQYPGTPSIKGVSFPSCEVRCLLPSIP